MTEDDLAAAHRCFSTGRRDPRYAWGLRGFVAFLQAHGRLKPSRPKSLSRAEQEVTRFLEYLRKDRGTAESTCSSCQRRVRHFLKFLGFDQDKTALRTLTLAAVHRYLRRVSAQYQRQTMQHVVGIVRGFLRFQFMRGIIHRPLHAQIDTVRTYQDEHLPYPVQWPELQQLLRRIDRSTPLGLRDYVVLLIAATYGMRASDVAKLTLDDVDWRKRTIQIIQCKTRQPLSLPLTDEVGTALVDYLRRARPAAPCRQIFLRWRAPIAPLSLPGMSNTLRRASQAAGVTLKAAGFRCLRHALALRLLRKGASTKDIGDILSHRSSISTSVYLRLNVEDYRFELQWPYYNVETFWVLDLRRGSAARIGQYSAWWRTEYIELPAPGFRFGFIRPNDGLDCFVCNLEKDLSCGTLMIDSGKFSLAARLDHNGQVWCGHRALTVCALHKRE